METHHTKMTDVYWQTDLTYSQCDEYMFEHKLYSDVTLRVHLKGQGRQLNEGHFKDYACHTYVLRRESAVLTELVKENNGVVQLYHPNIEEDIFTHFIRYLYSHRVDLTSDHSAMHLLDLALHYNVTGLERVIKAHLNEVTTPKTVCVYLMQARALNNQVAVGGCLVIIANQTRMVIDSAGFLKLSRDVLEDIMSQPEMNCFEIELFRACECWARAECDRQNRDTEDAAELRGVLGPVLDHIQFHFMTKDSLTEVLESRLLEQDPKEFMAVMKQWFSAEKENLTHTKRRPFNHNALLEPKWDSKRMQPLLFELGPTSCTTRIPTHQCPDVMLQLRQDQPFVYTHSYVLRARSPVLSAMMDHQPGNNNLSDNTWTLSIRDTYIEQEALQTFVRFLETDQAELNDNNITQLLYMSKVYLVGHLARTCVKHLSEHLHQSNALETLLLALMFDEKTLARQCLRSAYAKWILLKSKDFLLVPESSFAQVLEAAQAHGVPECLLLKAKYRWSDTKKKSHKDKK